MLDDDDDALERDGDDVDSRPGTAKRFAPESARNVAAEYDSGSRAPSVSQRSDGGSSVATNGAPSTAQGDDEEEEDPLDAFMAGISAEVAKEPEPKKQEV
jgi:hypothetical protein